MLFSFALYVHFSQNKEASGHHQDSHFRVCHAHQITKTTYLHSFLPIIMSPTSESLSLAPWVLGCESWYFLKHNVDLCLNKHWMYFINRLSGCLTFSVYVQYEAKQTVAACFLHSCDQKSLKCHNSTSLKSEGWLSNPNVFHILSLNNA